MTQNMEKPTTPFDHIGGKPVIARMVNRFYDLMDSDSQYTELRSMHARDLNPMRESLTDYLTAWMGGPQDWYEKRPGACIMSVHGSLKNLDMQKAEQWNAAMRRAADDCVENNEFVDMMMERLSRMSHAMVPR